MDACDPGHRWQPEHASKSYVRYRCADCGAVCAVPESVEEPFPAPDRAPDPRPAEDATPPPVEVPLWIRSEPPPSPPSAG